MADFDNTNRGALFKNTRKEQPNHADYNGTINIDGAEYYLNAWVKEGKNGKFFSLSIKPKSGDSSGRRVELNDDVPFAPEWR